MIQQYYHTAPMRDFILKQYGVKRYEETIELSESFFATILVGKHSFTEDEFLPHFLAPRYQNYQIHMVDMAFALSFFHFFPVSQDCLFFGKNPLRLPKSLFAQFHRAAPHS